MNNTKRIAKFLLVLSLFVFVAAGCGKKNSGSSNSNQATNQNQTIYTYEGQDGKTALQLLMAKYPEQVVIKAFPAGELVESINGKKAENNKTYWAFYVNGKYSNVGAGQYQTKSSDVIEWRLEQINPNL